MQTIVRWCLSNRPVVVLFGLILMGAGVFSIFRLNQELLPSVEFPEVYVLVADPGAGPAQVDRDVTQPLVSGLTGLPRSTHIRSSSSQGFSQVDVQFDLDSSLKDDTDAVNQRLGQVQLPASAQKPLVQTFSFTAVPSMIYTLSALDGNLARATQEANDVMVPALSGAAGVAQVKVSGGAQTQVSVTLDGQKLAAHGVSVQQVQQALTGANVDVPAGTTVSSDKTLPVQVVGAVSAVDDLRRIVVSPPAAPPVTLGDVATVAEAAAPVNGIYRSNGVPSLQIQVIRASNGNAVTLSADIKRRVAGVHMDPNDRLTLTTDSAKAITASLNDLLIEGLAGAFLAVLVIFLFLRSLRATLVTAVSLPTSVLIALLGTNLGGFSLNILTLAGLTIAVGRIVDDAIVVLENSYRHLQLGETPRQAALHGATEVSAAVISSTLTTVAVFLPIGVVGGIISRFFLPFSVTVTISLLASLLVALTIIPVLVSFFLQVRVRRVRIEEEGRLARSYAPVLRWALGSGWRKAGVLSFAAALLVLSVATLTRVPVNFFDTGGSDQLIGTVTLPPGTSAAQTSERLKAFETAAQRDPAVKTVQVTVASSDYGGYTAAFSNNVARLNVIVDSRQHADAAGKRLQRTLDQLYGQGNAQLGVVQLGPPSAGFTASLSGRDESALRQASDMVVAKLQQDADLQNARSDLAVQQPEVLVTVDPVRAASRGLSPQTVAFAVSGALTARDLGRLGPGGPPVSMQLDPAAASADRLPNLPLGPGTALKDVAAVTQSFAPTTVNRVDGTREVTVSADILGKDTQGASTRATNDLKKLSLPAGVTLNTGGTTQDINDSFRQMFIAIGVAIALVFLILVAFFRSVVTPFVILLTMPLALIGGFLALFVTQHALGLSALLGVLMVFGIVVSNAILLIDFVERIRADHHGLNDALIRAGSVRIRPILMTAVATIVALLPVAVGISSGGGGGLISQSLAIVVEGGLISSSFLTLLVIPIVYSLLRRRGAGRRPAVLPDAELVRPAAAGE